MTRIDDRLIAAKRADPSAPERRRHEAEVLARLDHPGIVEFLALVEEEDGDEDEVELHTAYAGTETWARTPPSDDRAVVDGLARVSSTVADLHAEGIAHRALVAEHVVVTGDHRPVLCGLADAADLDAITEADDLAGLAGLVRTLAPETTTETRARLEDLAADAAAGGLTARELAQQLDALSIEVSPTHPGPRSGRRFRRGAVLVPLALVVVGLVVWSTPKGNSGRPAAGGPTDAAPTASISTTAAPPSSVPRSTAPAAPSTTASPVVAPTTSERAPTLEFVHAGRRYGLGGPGDIAVLGDWNCDGTETPALLETGSGTIAIFTTWPAPGSSIRADTIGVAPDAVGLEADDHLECHRLRVLEPGGSHLFATAS